VKLTIEVNQGVSMAISYDDHLSEALAADYPKSPVKLSLGQATQYVVRLLENQTLIGVEKRVNLAEAWTTHEASPILDVVLPARIQVEIRVARENRSERTVLVWEKRIFVMV
jgi:hypothetical protein